VQHIASHVTKTEHGTDLADALHIRAQYSPAAGPGPIGPTGRQLGSMLFLCLGCRANGVNTKVFKRQD